MARKKQQLVNSSRRSFLRNSAVASAVLGAGTAGSLAADYVLNRRVSGAPSMHKRMVLINLFGGADGLNLVVPKTVARYYDRRPDIAIPVGTELSLDTGVNPNALYGLNPAMDRIHQLWQDGDVAIINQVGYPSANRSHFASMDIWSWGVRSGFAGLGVDPSGWVARFAGNYANTTTGVASFRVGRPLDLVGGNGQPLAMNTLATFKLDGESNSNFAANHTLQGEKVLEILQNSTFANDNQAEAANLISTSYAVADQAAMAIANYNSTVDYRSIDGNSNVVRDPGNGLRDMARLINAGFDTKLFYTGLGGWDHHSNILAAQAQRARWLDDAVGAFAQDMKDMGVWDDMAIVIFSEFGRRNFQNGSEGTDHGH
ncbi:MAG: DUF1501 domain-containing protein, partial [Planctomycetes bacterium]|nr:DUF1501 domain-containing protein [Planctomycetota bacterium]